MTSTKQSENVRVWFITGCSKGLGEALVREVLARGERAVVTARRLDSVQRFEQEFPKQALALRLDVTQPDSVQEAVAQAINRMGRIDVLVNNAGYGVVGAVEEASDREVRDIFETNVMGLLSVTRAVLPHMRQRRAGHILNISSMTGLFAPPGFGLYSGTKFAVEGLSEAMAAEVKPLGIRVTLVEPGPFRTSFRGGVVFAATVLPDYDTTVGSVRKTMAEPGGKQPGNPALAAKVMAEVVDAANPPLRLPLGQIAITQIRKKLASVERDVAEWEKVTAATSFAE